MMGILGTDSKAKPHAILIPFPAQGHLNPMFKLAKILHHKGFHITFVNSEYNHRRLLRSRGTHSLDGLPSFQFETIPDGLPFSDADTTQDVPSLCDSTTKNCLDPFRELVSRLNSDPDIPPVTCIVSDGIMSFTLEVARELGIPDVFFWTNGAGGVMAYYHYRRLVEKGYTPLKDWSYLTNGYMDTVIDWIPAMEGIRLKDLPSFVRTTDPNDIMLNYAMNQVEKIPQASALILNTFYALEPQVLDALSTMFPAVYTIGPLHLIEDNFPDNELKSWGSNLWKEEAGCIEWLDSKEPNSVVYVNFGSVTVCTPEQLVEFAWGLAKSEKTFLWIIRHDLVVGDTAILPPEFVSETKERGKLAGWCPQEDVLKHPSIGGFLTHCGWNSTFESICAGVPMLCWPFFAEQQTNCWYCCNHLGIAMEIDNNVKSDEVQKLVNELMVEEKGKEMKNKVTKLKKLAEVAITAPTGSSHKNLEDLINNVLLATPAN